MEQALYVKRDTTPSVIAGEAVMFTSRVHGTVTAPPRLFVVALESGTTFDVLTGNGSHVAGFSNTISGSGTLAKDQRETVSLISAINNKHHTFVVRCLTGRLAVTMVSPQEAKMHFRNLGRMSA